MGQKKKFSVRLTVPLSDEMLKLLDGSLDKGEPRLNLIRDAISREIEHRRLALIQPAEAVVPPEDSDPALSMAVREIIAREVENLRGSLPVTVHESNEIRRRIALVERNLARLNKILENPTKQSVEKA